MLSLPSLGRLFAGNILPPHSRPQLLSRPHKRIHLRCPACCWRLYCSEHPMGNVNPSQLRSDCDSMRLLLVKQQIKKSNIVIKLIIYVIGPNVRSVKGIGMIRLDLCVAFPVFRTNIIYLWPNQILSWILHKFTT